MESQEPAKWLVRPTLGPVAMPGKIVVPVDIFLCVSTFLNFTDYQSFVRAFWPDGDEDELIKKKLWQMSCHKLEATFYNGKLLDIEYNFDARREGPHRVLINVESLLPIFRGVQPQGLDKFVSILEFGKYFRGNVDMGTCSSYRYVGYPCRFGSNCVVFPILLMRSTMNACAEGHFHHYCKEHVISWLEKYLQPFILLRECEQLFDEEIAEQYALFPSRIPYFQSGSRVTSYYLLESALNMKTLLCEIAYSDNKCWLIDGQHLSTGRPPV